MVPALYHFFVFKNVVGDATGVHGGELEEFEPVVRAGLETELSGPGPQGVLIARRLEHLTFDLAPVARVVAVLEQSVLRSPLKLPEALPRIPTSRTMSKAAGKAAERPPQKSERKLQNRPTRTLPFELIVRAGRPGNRKRRQKRPHKLLLR